MEINNLEKELKSFFFKSSVLPLVLFAVCFFIPGESMTDTMWTYRLMVCLLGLTFVAVLWTSYNLRTVTLRHDDLENDGKQAAYAKAYKIRIATLNAISALCSVMYLVTKENNAAYLVGMMTILILLSFPTRSFISK